MDPAKLKALDVLSVAFVIALPICYVCSKKFSLPQRQRLIVLLWIVFLCIPYFTDMPLHYFTTMIASVLSFIGPLKLTQLVLFPSPTQEEDSLAVSKKTDNEPAHTSASTNNMTLSWKGFGSFVGSFLFYLVPISLTKEPRPPLSTLLKSNAINLAIVAFKIMIVPVFELALSQIATQYPYPSLTQDPIPYMQLEVLFTLELIAMAWSTDIQAIIVNVFSGGRFQMLYMHNYPFLSSSLRDLWGRRYNLLINSLLKETVYIPAHSCFGCSKQVASTLAFLTSGVLHSWVAHFTFGYGVLRASLFFLSQALWMNLVESRQWYRESISSLLKAVLTIFYFYATAWLYVGLFVEAMPDWLEKNSQEVANVPIISTMTRQIILKFGLA